MPAFKPKANKKIIIEKNANVTLDNKHKEFLKQFDNNNNIVIPSLFEEKQKLEKDFINTNILEDKLDIKDKIKEIRKKIKKLEKEQKNYYLNNSIHIFSYFENKKAVSEGNNKTTMLNNFFNKSSEKSINNEPIDDSSDIQKYLCNIDEGFLDIQNYVYQSDICPECNKGELVPIDYEGILLCNKCYKQFQYLIENEKPSYKEPPKEVCFYAYKRINHFREILAQFQAKETTQIPDEVLENIKAQIKKERISIDNITNKKCKDILKKLGYNKFYEHIPFIKDKLGIRPPVMSPELEDKLCNLFIEIQRPYSKYCPDDRVNFLNYYYTVYKLCELLGENEFLPFFPMLKDREKRIEQDEIWKKICGELEWEFVPTI